MSLLHKYSSMITHVTGSPVPAWQLPMVTVHFDRWYHLQSLHTHLGHAYFIRFFSEQLEPGQTQQSAPVTHPVTHPTSTYTQAHAHTHIYTSTYAHTHTAQFSQPTSISLQCNFLVQSHTVCRSIFLHCLIQIQIKSEQPIERERARERDGELAREKARNGELARKRES